VLLHLALERQRKHCNRKTAVSTIPCFSYALLGTRFPRDVGRFTRRIGDLVLLCYKGLRRAARRTLTLFGRWHGSPHIRMPGLAMARRQFHSHNDPCASDLGCAASGLPKSKASKAPVPLQPLLAQFMLFWKQKHVSAAATGVFPLRTSRANQTARPTCLSKII